jgi:hypothetical protein
MYSDCAGVNSGAHAHVEASGISALQTPSFWEIHNTGNAHVTQVVIDATTCVANGGSATGFSPAMALISGGNLAAGTAYRLGTEFFTGLQNLPAGFTSIPAGSATPAGLRFDFTSFTACTDELIFDCESIPGNSSGSAYVGATVTVSFGPGSTVTGVMIAHPTVPYTAVLDL